MKDCWPRRTGCLEPSGATLSSTPTLDRKLYPPRAIPPPRNHPHKRWSEQKTRERRKPPTTGGIFVLQALTNSTIRQYVRALFRPIDAPSRPSFLARVLKTISQNQARSKTLFFVHLPLLILEPSPKRGHSKNSSFGEDTSRHEPNENLWEPDSRYFNEPRDPGSDRTVRMANPEPYHLDYAH